MECPEYAGRTNKRDGALQGPACRSKRLLSLLRNVVGRKSGALSEEKVLHMFRNEILGLLLPPHQAVLVENHLHPLFPQLPGIERHVFEDALTEFSRPRRRIEAREFLLELHAEHFPSALVRAWTCGLRWFAVISHGSIVTFAFPARL